MPQFLADSPCPKLPDWIPKVLTGNPHCGPCHADHHGHLVVQLERPVVDIGLLEVKVVGEITQQMSHADLFVL